MMFPESNKTFSFTLHATFKRKERMETQMSLGMEFATVTASSEADSVWNQPVTNQMTEANDASTVPAVKPKDTSVIRAHFLPLIRIPLGPHIRVMVTWS